MYENPYLSVIRKRKLGGVREDGFVVPVQIPAHGERAACVDVVPELRGVHTASGRADALAEREASL